MSQVDRRGAPEACAWCAGKGKWAVSVGYVISCPVCGGKGKVLVAQPSAECRQCRGSGKLNAVAACLTCAGTGWGQVLGQ